MHFLIKLDGRLPSQPMSLMRRQWDFHAPLQIFWFSCFRKTKPDYYCRTLVGASLTQSVIHQVHFLPDFASPDPEVQYTRSSNVVHQTQKCSTPGPVIHYTRSTLLPVHWICTADKYDYPDSVSIGLKSATKVQLNFARLNNGSFNLSGAPIYL